MAEKTSLMRELAPSLVEGGFGLVGGLVSGIGSGITKGKELDLLQKQSDIDSFNKNREFGLSKEAQKRQLGFKGLDFLSSMTDKAAANRVRNFRNLWLYGGGNTATAAPAATPAASNLPAGV